MNKFAILILVMLMIPIVFGVTGTISSFYGQSNPMTDTILLLDNNHTFFLQVYKYGYITNAHINFKVLMQQNVTSIYRIENFHDTSTTSSVQLLEQDGNPYLYLSCSTVPDERKFCFFRDKNITNPYSFNYTFVLDNLGQTGQMQHGLANITNTSQYSILCNKTYSGGAETMQYGCYNGSEWFQIDAIKMYWNYTIEFFNINYTTGKYDILYNGSIYYRNLDFYTNQSVGVNPIWMVQTRAGDSRLHIKNYYVSTNVTVSVNNTEYNTERSNNFAAPINSILSKKCICLNCSIIGEYCYIPFTFFNNVSVNMSSTYTLNFSDVTYSYGIDNCTNSFGIPSNATAFNFTWKDLSNNGVGVNLSSTLTYDSTTYFNYYTHTSNFTYCVYPNWANISGNIDFQYISSGSVYSYTFDSAYFNNQTQNINFTIDTGSSQVTATVYDEINNPVEGAYIWVQRKDASTGNYVLIGIFGTNFEGQTKMPLILNTVLYRFLIYYPYSTLVKITEPTYIYATTINFQIVIGSDVLDDYYTSQNIYSRLEFLNETRRFRWIYADSASEITQACLYVYKNTNTTLYNSTCESAASGTIYTGVINTSGTTYIAKGVVTLDGVDIQIDSASYYYAPREATEVIGLMGIIIDIILTIAFAFMISFSIPIGVIMIPIPTLMLSLAGMIAINPAIAISVEVAALVVAVFINRR